MVVKGGLSIMCPSVRFQWPRPLTWRQRWDGEVVDHHQVLRDRSTLPEHFPILSRANTVAVHGFVLDIRVGIFFFLLNPQQ